MLRETIFVLKHSRSNVHAKGIVFGFHVGNAQPTFYFWFGDGFPAQEVDLALIFTAFQKEVSHASFHGLSNVGGDLYVLHYM